MDRPKIVAVTGKTPTAQATATGRLTDLEVSVLERMVERNELSPEEFEAEAGFKYGTTRPAEPEPQLPPQSPLQQLARHETTRNEPKQEPTMTPSAPADPQPTNPPEPEQAMLPIEPAQQPAVITPTIQTPATPVTEAKPDEKPEPTAPAERELEEDAEELARSLDKSKPRVVSTVTREERDEHDALSISHAAATNNMLAIKQDASTNQTTTPTAGATTAPATPAAQPPEPTIPLTPEQEREQAVERAQKLYEEKRRKAGPLYAIKRLLGFAPKE